VTKFVLYPARKSHSMSRVHHGIPIQPTHLSKKYTKRQQVIYLLIHQLHESEGWCYRKISQWLNKSSILTHTGKNWFSSSVISVLKRKHERDLMNQQIRNQYFLS